MKELGVSLLVGLQSFSCIVHTNLSNIESLHVEYVTDVESQKDDYSKYLVLEPKVKNDIEALCKMHVQSKIAKVSSTDFIKGKGEGLIFLLHGPPGVGKTCTAGEFKDLVVR